MDPREPFSQNIGGPWTPEVWHTGPDALVAEARAKLFGDRNELHRALTAKGNISGARGDHNEAELFETAPNEVGPGTGMDPHGLASIWRSEVKQLYNTEPLAAGAVGLEDGIRPPAP